MKETKALTVRIEKEHKMISWISAFSYPGIEPRTAIKFVRQPFTAQEIAGKLHEMAYVLEKQTQRIYAITMNAKTSESEMKPAMDIDITLVFETVDEEEQKAKESWEEIRDEAEPCVASQVLAIIDESLIPPTADNVCEVYFEYINTKLLFDKTTKMFQEIKGGRSQGRLIASYFGNKIKILHSLPPHLITLIGRFYESEARK